MSTTLPVPINTVISIGLLPGNCWAVAAATAAGGTRTLAMAMILVRVIECILPPLPLLNRSCFSGRLLHRAQRWSPFVRELYCHTMRAANAALAGAPVMHDLSTPQ